MTEDKVPELRAKATQAYSFMLRSVRAKLNGMIADAMSAMLNNDDGKALLCLFTIDHAGSNNVCVVFV